MPHLRFRNLAIFTLLIILGSSTTAAADSLTLAWDANTEATVLGYVVYIGTAPGTYSTVVDVGNTTEYTFTDAQKGTTYYLTVAAYASGSVTGARAAEVIAKVGGPALTNPGNRSSTRGSRLTLALTAASSNSQGLTFSATGLPPGLTLNPRSGLISGVPTTAGSFNVSITLSDASGNVATQSFSWTIAPTDSAAPTLTISSPAGSTLTTSQSFATLTGSAADDVAVALITWSNARGGSGIAAGTSSWSVVIPLQPGSNMLTITALDSAGRLTSKSLTITLAGAAAAPLRLTQLVASRPGPAGVAATFTATASGGTAPYQYKWMLFDGTSWSVIRSWSNDGSLVWTPLVPNTAYRIGVWIRNAAAASDAPDNNLSKGEIAFPVRSATLSTATNSLAIDPP